jgi:hypothetical protein
LRHSPLVRPGEAGAIGVAITFEVTTATYAAMVCPLTTTCV